MLNQAYLNAMVQNFDEAQLYGTKKPELPPTNGYYSVPALRKVDAFIGKLISKTSGLLNKLDNLIVQKALIRDIAGVPENYKELRSYKGLVRQDVVEYTVQRSMLDRKRLTITTADLKRAEELKVLTESDLKAISKTIERLEAKHKRSAYTPCSPSDLSRGGIR